MITALYASVLALWIAFLSLRVVALRRSRRVKLGDGGDAALQIAIRIHGNAAEYVPLALILLALLELAGASVALLHGCGLALLVGRALHARGLWMDQLRFRVLGMQLTLSALIVLALANLGYAIGGRAFGG